MPDTAPHSFMQNDAVTILTGYVVLLVAVPSDLRLGALGGAGAPAALWSLAAGLWWCWFQLQRPRAHPDTRLQPVRLAMFLFLGAILASYVAAMLRPLPPTEASQADIGVLRMLAAASILLLASDGIPGPGRFLALVRRISWAGAALALLGLAQFATGKAFVDAISIPGLSSSQDFSAVVDRGGFTRSAGTAMSPLEYASALSMAFPLALTLALYDRDRRFVVRWLPAATIAVALLVSGSRSALLGLFAGAIVLFFSWPARTKMWMAVVGVLAVVGVAVTVPGMFGTIRYLFTNTSNDPSALSRTGSYEVAGQFFDISPFFGRGFGTFLPQYRIFDNEYLLLLIETGLLGVVAFLGIVLAGAGGSIVARRRIQDPLLRQIGQALAASLVAGALLNLFFDAFSFPMAVGFEFLIAGLCGGYWRLARPAESPVTVEAGPAPD